MLFFSCQLSYFFFWGRTRNRRKGNTASQVNNILPKHFPSSICPSSEKHIHVIYSPEGLCAIRGCWAPLREQQDRAHPTIPDKSGAAGGTRASPGWDAPTHLGSHSQTEGAPKVAPKRQVHCWLQPPRTLAQLCTSMASHFFSCFPHTRKYSVSIRA